MIYNLPGKECHIIFEQFLVTSFCVAVLYYVYIPYCFIPYFICDTTKKFSQYLKEHFTQSVNKFYYIYIRHSPLL